METIQEKRLLQEILSPLEAESKTEEYSKLWQKLFDSARDLDQFYEEGREAVFEFKNRFDEIRQTEQLNDALRHVYYDALSTKKKHERDRDSYFECDKRLAELKNNFVSESQALALKSSRYIEFNQRFVSKREEHFAHFLSEFGKICEENNSLKRERIRLVKERNQSKVAHREIKEQFTSLENNFKNLSEKFSTAAEERNSYKKEAEWMKRENSKLTDSVFRLEQELSSLNEEINNCKENTKEQEAKEIVLSRENTELSMRCHRLEELSQCYVEQISSLQAENEVQNENWQNETLDMTRKLDKAKQQLAAARENNHKTIMKNQQLREKLSSATHRIDKVTREKLRSILKEHKTQRTNTELTTHQLLLIDEVLELKSDFFHDQARIREGARLNRKLKVDVRSLQDKVQKLKDNSLKIDPLLDGADEYRKQLLRKFGAKKSETSLS